MRNHHTHATSYIKHYETCRSFENNFIVRILIVYEGNSGQQLISGDLHQKIETYTIVTGRACNPGNNFFTGFSRWVAKWVAK